MDCALLNRRGMEHPPASRSPHRSTVVAFLVALTAGASGCAAWSAASDTAMSARGLRPHDVTEEDDIAVVTIDSGATMSLTPGDGAGIFVQYAQGGHWNLTTTCDTRSSGQSCAFDIVISPSDGATFSGVQGQDLSSADTLELRSDGTVRLVTSTSYGTNGISFDSDPGATVEIDALLDGAAQPSFVNVVSEGAVLAGVPTNPVDFSPSDP